MNTQKKSETGEGNAPRGQPRVEFWEKDGYWHIVEPSGKWSVEGYESSTEAWKASNKLWEAAK